MWPPLIVWAAADSGQIYLERRKVYAQIPFYCETGRAPTESSAETLSVRPFPGCTFAGPLDTRVDRRKLEPPFLNPLLTMEELTRILAEGGALLKISEDGESLGFVIPSGAAFTVSEVNAKELTDTLFQFAAYPSGWGAKFLSVSAIDERTLREFVSFAQNLPLNLRRSIFWQNPHVEQERAVWPRLTSGTRAYLPLPLVSKCADEWRNFGAGLAQSLLLAGDMHTAEDTEFLLRMIKQREFAWVALEITQDRDEALARFLAAEPENAENPVGDESKFLDLLADRKSNETIQPFKDLMRELKRQKKQIFLIDYKESYFNFPYTDTSFHGMVVAARNLIWTERLPARWEGTGLLLGGLDHFAATPGADFQNFAWEKFPGLTIGLVWDKRCLDTSGSVARYPRGG